MRENTLCMYIVMFLNGVHAVFTQRERNHTQVVTKMIKWSNKGKNENLLTGI